MKPTPGAGGSFLVRFLVAVAGIPALLWIFYRGGYWLQGLVVLLVVLGCREAARVAEDKGIPVSFWLLLLITLPVPLWVWPHGGTVWILWVGSTLALGAVAVVWLRDPVAAALAAMVYLVTAVWLGLGFGALIAVRGLDPAVGFHWLIFLFANLWIGDTAAYLVGSWLGGPKLSSRISPRKTVSGAIGQVVVSVAVGGVFALAGWIDVPWTLLLLAAVVVGTIGQVGDLFASVFKRAAGIKDYSGLIPGHGGILDRFDSTLFAAPALWILVRYWPS